MKKSDANPMHLALRCTAKSKRTGLPCKNPAVRGWKVCRMHGARGGANPGKDHPNYRHGERSQEAATVRALVTALLRESREANQGLNDPVLPK